jgi:two-component system response regulator DesR
MPIRSGLEVVRAANAQSLPTRCGLLSSFGNPLLVAEALRSGADGYLLKEDAPTTLADGAARLAAGECVISPAVDRAALRDAMNSLAVSGREMDVLRLLVQGAPASEMASRLGISPRTVETYRNQLVVKFGARNAVDLVRRAVESGFLVGQ